MQIKSKAEKLNLRINFLGRKDHLDPALQDYQVIAFLYQWPQHVVMSISCQQAT